MVGEHLGDDPSVSFLVGAAPGRLRATALVIRVREIRLRGSGPKRVDLRSLFRRR
jgi:hypothetical protein